MTGSTEPYAMQLFILGSWSRCQLHVEMCLLYLPTPTALLMRNNNTYIHYSNDSRHTIHAATKARVVSANTQLVEWLVCWLCCSKGLHQWYKLQRYVCPIDADSIVNEHRLAN